MKVSHKSAFALVVSLCFSFRIAYGDLAPATGSLPRFIDMGTSSILLRYRPDGTLAQRRHTRRYTELFTDRRGVTRERVRTDETRHTFAGSFESVSGRGWIYHFDGGYVTMTDGEAHYFARDYQGSTRAVYTASLRQIAPLTASADGAAAANGLGDVTVMPRYTLEQATDYYPTGLPVDITAEMTDAPAASAATDMLHIGNRWINHAGLGYYDNTARYFDALTVRFTAADQLEWKTPQLSPWSHCAGNPVNFIDPSGMESIYVYRNNRLEKVGETTDPDDKNKYLLNSTDLSNNSVYNNIQDGVTYSQLPNNEEVAILPNAEELDVITNSMNQANKTNSEQGGHIDENGEAHAWDSGDPYLQGEDAASIDFFRIDGHRVSMPWTSKLYWHVHPKVNVLSGQPVLGYSNPSPNDFSYDMDFRSYNYQGSALLVGGRTKEITFYYKNTIIGTIPIKEIERILGTK